MLNARVFLNGCCKVIIIYDDDSSKFTFIKWTGSPVIGELEHLCPSAVSWPLLQPLPKVADSMDHSVKGYADDTAVISTNIDSYRVYSFLCLTRSQLHKKYTKGSRIGSDVETIWMSHFFDDVKHLSQGIPLHV